MSAARAVGRRRPPRAVILMGVSGSGKSTVGLELARRLGWRYADADDYHPPENVAKMRGGTPLTDEDRRPWLERLRALLRGTLAADASLVLACSALKRRYRELLDADDPRIALVYLRGTPELIAERLSARRGHYFDPALLQSQFDALEEPDGALVVDIDDTPAALVDTILRRLGLTPHEDEASAPAADGTPASPPPKETP